MRFDFTAAGARETEELGFRLGQVLRRGDCVALFGGMGAGKTLFARGVAAGLSLKDAVTSPTFALVNEYTDGPVPMLHFDMYRLSTPEDLESSGFWDYDRENAVFVIEWAQNIERSLPPGCVRVRIAGNGDSPREISIDGEGLPLDFGD